MWIPTLVTAHSSLMPQFKQRCRQFAYAVNAFNDGIRPSFGEAPVFTGDGFAYPIERTPAALTPSMSVVESPKRTHDGGSTFNALTARRIGAGCGFMRSGLVYSRPTIARK